MNNFDLNQDIFVALRSVTQQLSFIYFWDMIHSRSLTVLNTLNISAHKSRFYLGLDFPPFTNTLLATLARKVFFTIVTQTSATSSPPSPVVYQLTSASLDGLENSFLLMLNKFKSCVNYCQELLTLNLSRPFALKYFSPNIVGAACFAFSPKLSLDLVFVEF